MKLTPGHIIDLAAIVAFTVLAAIDKLPAAIVASVITMIVAARFRPPADVDASPPRGPELDQVERQSAPPSSSSGGSLVSIVIGGWAMLRRTLGIGVDFAGRHRP